MRIIVAAVAILAGLAGFFCALAIAYGNSPIWAEMQEVFSRNLGLFFGLAVLVTALLLRAAISGK